MTIPEKYKNETIEQNHTISFQYVGDDRSVQENIIDDHGVLASVFGRFDFQSYERVLDRLINFNQAKGNEKDATLKSFFPQSANPFQLLSMKIMTQYVGRTRGLVVRFSPTLIFGHPMHRDYLEDKLEIARDIAMVQREKEPQSANDLIEKFKKQTISSYLKLDIEKTEAELFAKSGKKSDWQLNELCLLPVSNLEKVVFIHPQDYNKVWENGRWVDLIWTTDAIDEEKFDWESGGGSIVNGNIKNIPRLS